jgi:hypothetical protein
VCYLINHYGDAPARPPPAPPVHLERPCDHLPSHGASGEHRGSRAWGVFLSCTAPLETSPASEGRRRARGRPRRRAHTLGGGAALHTA